jgi:hypothetical protein
VVAVPPPSSPSPLGMGVRGVAAAPSGGLTQLILLAAFAAAATEATAAGGVMLGPLPESWALREAWAAQQNATGGAQWASAAAARWAAAARAALPHAARFVAQAPAWAPRRRR